MRRHSIFYAIINKKLHIQEYVIYCLMWYSNSKLLVKTNPFYMLIRTHKHCVWWFLRHFCPLSRNNHITTPAAFSTVVQATLGVTQPYTLTYVIYIDPYSWHKERLVGSALRSLLWTGLNMTTSIVIFNYSKKYTKLMTGTNC